MPPHKGFNLEAYKRAVKCKVCKKIRSQNAFSKRQLEELRKAMLKCGTTGLDGPGYAGCRNCISHQTVELTCCVCDKTKPLEYFSKTQRRDPDNARCTNCVQGLLDAEPVAEDTKLLLDNESAIGTSTYLSQSDGYALSSFRSLSITGDENYEVMSDHTANLSYQAPSNVPSKGKAKEENASLGGGVWVEQGGRLSEEMIGAKGGEDIPFTAYDAQGNGHLRTVAPPSETGNSVARSGWDAWKAVPSVRSRKPNQPAESLAPKKNANFAKILGQRVPKEQAPNMYLPEPSGQTIDTDDSDEEEDDIQNWI
ncbi:hypothetical protein PRK78_002702 [Emydomyces testavorans]|uniref:Stc1 domain-containing protein n=1 Tax=Emydomyces testavorans TaxID=2070801 RepID=A0AAF0IHU5_9EURO|nr:hypothetical protein PRK78_002702 [Emydomyces testavorans]